MWLHFDYEPPYEVRFGIFYLCCHWHSKASDFGFLDQYSCYMLKNVVNFLPCIISLDPSLSTLMKLSSFQFLLAKIIELFKDYETVYFYTEYTKRTWEQNQTLVLFGAVMHERKFAIMTLVQWGL